MPDSLSDLEQRREVLAQGITELSDLRPGSITGTSGRCGKPECHCHQPGQPGHGPNFRLTYKVDVRPSRKRCPPLRRSRKPSEKWRSSGNSNSSLVSFWGPTRRSVVCGLSMRCSRVLSFACVVRSPPLIRRPKADTFPTNHVRSSELIDLFNL